MILWQDGEYQINTDRMRLDVPAIHNFLVNAYWSKGRSLDVVRQSLEHSLCFGLYHQQDQIGFGRVISDFSTFAYIADVYVLDQHRGRGLGKRLIACITQHDQLQGLKRWLLVTAAAHRLYEPYGFSPLTAPERFMEKLASQKTVPL